MSFHPCVEFALSCLAWVSPRSYLPMGEPGKKKRAPVPNEGGFTLDGYAAMEMWEQQNLDPLRVQQWPPRLGTALSILNTTKLIQRNMEAFNTPMYLLGGTEDGVCMPEAVRELHQRACANDKAITQYEGYGHCILAEEPTRAAKVEADIRKWLVAHSKSRATTNWSKTPVPSPRRSLGRLALLVAISLGVAYLCHRCYLGMDIFHHGVVARGDL
eukprot:SAG31_NODE_2433_length_5706_cov_2.207776_3_plen_215_part_00